jgi:hypothetical protein
MSLIEIEWKNTQIETFHVLSTLSVDHMFVVEGRFELIHTIKHTLRS